MLNGTQVMDLFMENCFLIQANNVVSFTDAIRMFGEDAVEHAKTVGVQGSHYGIYNVKDEKSVEYLSYSGFQYAATFCNVMEIARQEEKLAAMNAAKSGHKKLIAFPAKRKSRKKAAAGGGADA